MSNGTMKVNNGRFVGQIVTMAICLNFALEPQGRNSDKSPGYKVMAKAPAGHTFQAGVAWEYEIKRGEKIGQSMFSLTLEDPAFGDKPIYFSAFPQGDGYKITLGRARSTQQASPKEDAEQGDDVPFDAPAAA